MSKVQADADDSRVDASRIALTKVETEKRLLVDFIKGRTIQDLTAKFAEANRALNRVKGQARAKLVQADADRLAKDSVYKQEIARKQEIEGEIAKCLVLAPRTAWWFIMSPAVRNNPSWPRGNRSAKVRRCCRFLICPTWWSICASAKQRFPHCTMNVIPKTRGPGNSRTSASMPFPNSILHGHVKVVDTLAAQQESWAADVKLYKTVISIDEPVQGLKPGMSAEVTIHADESPTEVMAVPVQAVIGTIRLGANLKCFVVGADGQPELRDIVVGMSNQRLVEVKSGLKKGDRVVLNTAPLLAEDGETNLGKAGSKDDDTQGSGGNGNKKKK